jgi:hypothetical protein
MHPLLSKSARVGAWYVAGCAIALLVAQRQRLALTTDARHAVVRELLHTRERAEVLFIGSSQTARGVIPAAFDDRYRELTGRDAHSLNLSTLGNARHIAFLTLESWLRDHEPPDVIAVEVGVLSDLPEYPHSTLTRFMDPRDAARVVAHAPYVARDHNEFARKSKSPPRVDPLGAFTAMDRRALHFELALDVLGRGVEDCVRAAFAFAVRRGADPYWKHGEDGMLEVIAEQTGERGFYRIDPDSPLGVDGAKKRDEQTARVSIERSLAFRWEDQADEPDDFGDPSRYRATKLYAQALADLCRARGIRLVFLDQPNYRGRPLRPSQIAFYRSLGELFVQDKSVLYQPEMFQDPGHLSVRGAEYASRALAEFLATNARKSQ